MGGVIDRQDQTPPAAPVRLSVMSKRGDFLAANRGLRVSRPGFVLLAQPNGDRGLRFGITVTKRIGNAVVRNRMKRRFRELLRELLPAHGLPAHDHVLIGREGGIERDFAALRNELRAALGRAAAGKGDPPRPRQGKGGPAHRTRGKGGKQANPADAPSPGPTAPRP